MEKHDTPEKNYDLERLLFFSDGVFAIAITLLVIELHPPHDWNGSFIELVRHIGAEIIFYLISFFAIGAFWMSHRMMFRHVRVFNETASWLNVLFLALIALVPLANQLLVPTTAHRLTLDAVWTYVGLMSCASLVGGLLWAYMSLIARVVDPELTTAFKLAVLFRMSIMPPLMCSASLWVGVHYGLPASGVFAAVLIFISSRFGLRASRKKAKLEDTPPNL